MPAANNASRMIRAAAAAATVAATLALPASASASGCANANADPNAISLRAARQATLCLLNDIRRAHGLRPFHDNHRLNRASQRHSRDMVRHHYFAHGNFVSRIQSARYLFGARGWTVGENIAWGTYSAGTPAAIVNAWMNSPPHRANILNPTFGDIGIGVARGAPSPGLQDGATYDTDFGARR